MSTKNRVKKRKKEKMPDFSFRMMKFIYNVIDFFHPHVGKRVRKFDINEGMTVVDYGCGPGRYSVKFAELVGEEGKVYALDIHRLAIETVKKKIARNNLRNIEPILIEGYDSTLPDGTADVVCAIDMFWIIKKPKKFLAELKRVTKKRGTLVIDDGHQPRSVTKKKLLDSGFWKIIEETEDHLKCKQR